MVQIGLQIVFCFLKLLSHWQRLTRKCIKSTVEKLVLISISSTALETPRDRDSAIVLLCLQ